MYRAGCGSSLIYTGQRPRVPYAGTALLDMSTAPRSRTRQRGAGLPTPPGGGPRREPAFRVLSPAQPSFHPGESEVRFLVIPGTAAPGLPHPDGLATDVLQISRRSRFMQFVR